MARRRETRTAEVHSGMEMLRWTYTEADWLAHVGAEKERIEKSELMRPPAALLTGGLAVLIVAILGVLRAGSGIALALVVLLALALGLWAGPRLSADRAINRLRKLVKSPPEVLFTSTGVVFGEQAWLWRPERGWLAHVEVIHDNPTYLLLRFVRVGLGPTTVQIPVPEKLVADVMEIAKLLENKVPKKPEL